MPRTLESNIRQILQDVCFPTPEIKYEFCDVLTFAYDEEDFFMRANQFLSELCDIDLNHQFYDKAKAYFGAEIIDLYFDNSLISYGGVEELLLEHYQPSTEPVPIQTMATTVSEQLDLFTQPDPAVLDDEDILQDNSTENIVGQNPTYEESSHTSIDEEFYHENQEDIYEEDRHEPSIQDEFSSDFDLGDTYQDDTYQDYDELNFETDWYPESTPSGYEHEDNFDTTNEIRDHVSQADSFYEDEFDLDETSLNIYDIEELESANAESDDFEIPDIGYSEDILGATLNRVAVQDRITQEVIKFIDKNDLDYTEYKSVLESIFFHLGWNGAKNAVQRLFNHNADLSVAMLTAIFELKLAWEEHDAFWAIRHKNGSFENTYAVLSWPIAYAIIDSYSYIPDTEEVIDLLYQKFYQWYDSPILPRAFPCFMKYIWSQFFGIKGLLPQTYHEDFMFNEFTPELWADSYDLLDSQFRKALVEHGIAVNESFPSLENWTLEKARERLRALNETQNSINTEADDE